MKWLRIILLSILTLAVLTAAGIYFWLRSSSPEYSGELRLAGLTAPVECYFDDFGIPHIYAENKEDMYLAFGYVHAQDRLFQMEMLRRAGSGRLAEIIGQPMVKIDRMFLTLGLREYAAESAAHFETQRGSSMYNEVQSYLRGINTFILEGKTPPEFSIIGIEKTLFTVEDLYYITGAMSFSFSQAQKTEPVIDYISDLYGEEYLRDMGLWHQENESYIPVSNEDQLPKQQELETTPAIAGIPCSNTHDVLAEISEAFREIEELMPVSLLQGSNSWVVSGEKTESGAVLFCNDTHIGYMLPQTWYEAHLETNNFKLYGHFMAGIPFALVGRNDHLSWGLTMLLNDDMDFYEEKPDPGNADAFLFESKYEKSAFREYQIKVKGEADTTFGVRVTRHGPLINDAFDGMNQTNPISMFWTYTKLPNHNIDALYGLNNATNMETFEVNLAKIHAPGLSVSYGDHMGNVAWWGCASLIQRKPGVNSWTILDGSISAHEPSGFYPFEKNPKNINPECGFIYSANDWPQDLNYGNLSSDSALWYPGYYKPQYRADRINKLLKARNDWTLENMKSVMTDIKSDADSALMRNWLTTLSVQPSFSKESDFREYAQLMDWDGTYDPENPSPTLFNRMLYHYLHDAMADELGENLFRLFLETHQIQRTQLILAQQDSSKWWDNVHTDAIETKAEILFHAFEKTISDLKNEFGPNYKIWNWKKCMSFELKHPLGEVALFKPFFNEGPHTVCGGNETILQSGFKLDSTGHYKVFFGSQMRIMVDFANTDSALNITPSGQSGHLLSPHYNDQAKLYREKKFRLQTMDKERIVRGEFLMFKP